MTLMESAAAIDLTDATATINFADGLVGFPTWQNFVLMTDDQENLPIGVLQSQDDPKVALLVTDPRLILQDYTVELDATTRDALQLDSVLPAIYCTLSVTQDGTMTADLLGPLVINPSNRRAAQLVLAESAYSTRHFVAQLGQSGS
jgi:flagellar assembly factor FliW